MISHPSLPTTPRISPSDSQLQSQLRLNPLTKILRDILLRRPPIHPFKMQILYNLADDDPSVIQLDRLSGRFGEVGGFV